MAAALSRVIDAGSRYVGAQVDRARTEAGKVLQWGAVLAGGAILALAGWAVLLAALVLALRPQISPAASLAVIGAVHLLAGAVLARAAVRRLAGAPPPATDTPPSHEPQALPTRVGLEGP